MDLTNIFLIRHGELDNPSNTIYDGTISLSKEGRENMRLLGITLKKRSVIPDVVFTSPFLRAVQSTEELLSNYESEIPVIKDSRLQDTDAPDNIGKPLSWLREVGNPYTYPGIRIESPNAIADRMVASIKNAIDQYEGKTLFVVSHGDPTAFALWKLLHPESEMPPLPDLQNPRDGSVKYLQKAQAWRVVMDTAHHVIEHEFITRELKIQNEREL